MSFDKARAMRNAERYVSQGKIRSAISEYREVVDNDPRDIATLNMLGDLHAKNSEKKEAVNCYMQVAEHYHTQGFAQKAIAVYNKISRIQPDSIEVSTKLAELHKSKGSLSDARSHYMTLAEHYQKTGKRLEALAMYKQIALLDPNNTEVCLNLAESYMRENQREEAIEAYAEAGTRFGRQNRHEEAVRALMKGFEITATDLRILNGLVKAQTALGRATKAVSLLEEILENDPYNRDVLYLLIECCIDSQNAVGAEKAVIKLVEIEPANYPKFLDLIRIYLNVNDPESAGRILTISSEYMLAAGQGDECGKWIDEILERDAMQLTGLRLLVRYNSHLNDENGFRLALERLYTAATTRESVEDERFALSHLVVIRPHETRYRDRLAEINEKFGFAENAVDEELLKAQFVAPEAAEGAAEYTVTVGHDDADAIGDDGGFEIVTAAGIADVAPLSASDELKVQKEIDSVTFYIENDYNDLAEKALAELAKEYGDRPEFAELRRRIGAEFVAQETPTEEAAEAFAEQTIGAPPETETIIRAEFEPDVDTLSMTESQPVVENHEEIVESPVAGVVVESIEEPAAAIADELVVASTLGIDEIRSEFGIETPEAADGDDYETHYHMAIAYQEMGLMEAAIREYQDAINLAEPNDGTRNFFQCSNLLGHCFMQNGHPNHAITWFNRALETPEISDEEYHGIWYELAMAHEANDNEDEAARYFEQIYAENVDFRDVGERVRNFVAG